MSAETLVQEILDREEPDVMLSRCKRTLDRIQYIRDCCGGKYDMQKYSDFIDEHEKILDELTKKLTDLKNDKNKDMPTVINKLEEMFSETIAKASSTDGTKKYDSILYTFDIKGLDNQKQKLREKIGKDIVKKYKKFVEDSYKGVNTWTKMLTGIFITIPLTCTALNWLYPRIMDKFFPELAGSKKVSKSNKNAQGGQKCQ